MTDTAFTSRPTEPPTDHQSTDRPGARTRVRRSGTDRMAGGVCGGLADYSGVDAVLWRVGFVGLTVVGGSGVLIYLLLWVLLPPSVDDAAPGRFERLARRLRGAVAGFREASPPA